MNSSEELYNRLEGTLSTLVSVPHVAELKSKIATYVPGETQAESRVTMIRRWLMNLHVDVWSFYKPVLEHALKDWQGEVANIILDGVMVGGGQWQILRLSLAHGQRAIPLGWVVARNRDTASGKAGRNADPCGRIPVFAGENSELFG